MLVQIVTSFIASAAFAILLTLPNIWPTSVRTCWYTSWMIYTLLLEHADDVLAALVATFLVLGIVSQMFAPQ